MESLREKLGNLKDWVYVGNNFTDCGKFYYRDMTGEKSIKIRKNVCCCGRMGLEKNFYVQHWKTKKIEIIGSNCIKHFKKNKIKKCILCQKYHKKTSDVCIKCIFNNDIRGVYYEIDDGLPLERAIDLGASYHYRRGRFYGKTDDVIKKLDVFFERRPISRVLKIDRE